MKTRDMDPVEGVKWGRTRRTRSTSSTLDKFDPRQVRPFSSPTRDGRTSWIVQVIGSRCGKYQRPWCH
jgi:hypothetical protein